MDKIVVLDFGGQYTQLIAKAVRKCNVFSEIKDSAIDIESIKKENYKGIILSGGPDSVYEECSPKVDRGIFDLGIPVFGICYGMQLINYELGGGTLKGDCVVKEYGKTTIEIIKPNLLFSNIRKEIIVWMSHGDSVDEKKIAEGFKVIARTKDHVAAIANDEKNIYGVQFHPEVTHTPEGLDIISNFVHKICGCDYDWTMGNFIEQSKQYIREKVGKNDVICFVSGGVDSSFVAKLLSRTEGIGNVYNVYIGVLMRKGENEEVVETLKKAGVKNLIFRDYEKRFIKKLEGVSDSEEKRITTGNEFVKIQEEICEELHLDTNKTMLAMGSLYTDIIESGKGVGKKAAKIKSHHNVGCPFIERLKEQGRVVEPNKWIFKDEVRLAAKEIGLPAEIYERQPFPGPGLAIRIVDSKAEWINDKFYELNCKVSELASNYNLKGYVLPVKTVGVQGDARTYTYLALLRGERDWEKIRRATNEITNKIHEVNRVVYDVNSEEREIHTDKIIPTTINGTTVNLLKDVDYAGRKIIENKGFEKKISQTIFVLFGADIYNTGKRSVALRAVLTDDFMTVTPISPESDRLSWDCLDIIYKTLIMKYDVGAFVIDVTDKPPSTTCWE
jgi:GMP synthase (glutamine-hydrolysing)